MAERMALAAPSELATTVGTRIVDMGGGAADVVVGMALVAMCTEPGVCAPGAGGFITVDPVDGPPMVVDGYMAVPGLGFAGDTVTKMVTMDYGGGLTTAVGPGSIAVPGGFASLSEVASRFGLVPWDEILEVVAGSLEHGFPLSQACHIYLVDSGVPVFSDDAASRAALFDGDRLKDIGDSVCFDDLADTLRQIGEEGAETFYRGDLARTMIADLANRGSSLTTVDLATYRALDRAPLTVEIGAWQVSSNPPPAVGGVTMLSAVREISSQPDPLDHQGWAMALTTALRHRRRYEDSEGRDAAIEELMVVAGLRSPSTVSVAAVDQEANAVAATFSSGYGSGVVPSGTGLLMNNSIGELELMPAGIEALVPGERMMSNMAPTTCRSPGSVVAIGSPGADRITSALALTLVNLLIAGEDLVGAIEHPRVHPEHLEPVALAAERGLNLAGDVRWYDEPHMFFGGVNGAGLIDGKLVAHADSRRVGSAIVV